MKKVYLLLFLVLSTLTFSKEILKLATTTSTYETGILDYILKPFIERHDVDVHIISVGTGKAIKLGENGDVDIILVHARRAEDKFVSDGYGVNRRDVMYNDFVIAGPENDPVGIKELSPKDAFKKIADNKTLFISRGDNSGTNKKEIFIWKKAEIDPEGNKWYIESGQGMSATLRIADEKNGYVLVDRGSYLFAKDKLRLKILNEGGDLLLNPYGIIPVSPYKHPHVKYELSMALTAWITSLECQKMIDSYKVKGSQLFKSNAQAK